MTCICEGDGLIFKGKRPSELNLEEAVQAAKYFRAITVRQYEQLVEMGRRMGKLEETLSQDEIARLDTWLHDHPIDVVRGDGTPYYQDWRRYQPRSRSGG